MVRSPVLSTAFLDLNLALKSLLAVCLWTNDFSGLYLLKTNIIVQGSSQDCWQLSDDIKHLTMPYIFKNSNYIIKHTCTTIRACLDPIMNCATSGNSAWYLESEELVCTTTETSDRTSGYQLERHTDTVCKNPSLPFLPALFLKACQVSRLFILHLRQRVSPGLV